jgi:integrase
MAQYRRKLKKGDRWWFKFDDNGKTHASQAIYLTKREAAKAEQEERKRLESVSGEASLLDVITHRLDYLELTRNKEYYRDQRRLSKKIIDRFGNIQITDITAKMVSVLFLDEIKRCKNEGLGNKRPNELLKTLRTTISHARSNFGIEMRDPTAGIKKLPNDIKTPYIPSEEEIEAVINICNHEQKRLIRFVYETGCRIGEAINLEYRDVHETYVTLYTMKSQNSRRTPRHLPRPSFIFPSGCDKVFEFTAYPRFLEEKVRELSQPTWCWHSLRRRRASIWAQSKPLFEIMMLLGHSQIATTQMYLFQIGIVKM